MGLYSERVKHALEKYLNSKGAALPQDLQNYTSPKGDKKALCVLCDRVHDYHPLVRREFISRGHSQTYIIAGAYTCDECNKATERSEIFETEQERVFRKQREMAINDFVNEGVFPKRAHLHYLDGTRRSPGSICVFCESRLMGTAARTLDVPVGHDIYHIDGGKVFVCVECMDEINSKIPEEEFSQWLRNTFHIAECASCSSKHAITQDELQMRQMNKTLNRMFCPECAVANLERDEGHSVFYKNTKALDGRFQRYVDTKCSYCAGLFSVDQMVHPSFLLENYVSEDGHVSCEDCYQYGLHPIEVIKSDEFVWAFYHGLYPGTGKVETIAIKRTRSGVIKNFEILKSPVDILRYTEKIKEEQEETITFGSVSPNQQTFW